MEKFWVFEAMWTYGKETFEREENLNTLEKFKKRNVLNRIDRY